MLTGTARYLPEFGLRIRGTFNPGSGDGAPDGVQTLLLIGYLGGEMWPIFQRQGKDEPNPLDGWTRRVIDPLAKELGAVALYPFEGPPWLPFQRWAMRAEGLTQSPVGPLIHPEYGLWHGYRAALGLRERIAAVPPALPKELCADCQAKLCLAACPAGVFDGGRYDLPLCRAYLKTADNACLDGGCLARRACPVGSQNAYGPEQARFHMQAFLAAFGN